MDPCEQCPIKQWNVQKTQIIKNLEFQNDELKKRISAQSKVIEAAREAVRVWGDGERYGSEMIDLESVLLDLADAEPEVK